MATDKLKIKRTSRTDRGPTNAPCGRVLLLDAHGGVVRDWPIWEWGDTRYCSEGTEEDRVRGYSKVAAQNEIMLAINEMMTVERPYFVTREQAKEISAWNKRKKGRWL